LGKNVDGRVKLSDLMAGESVSSRTKPAGYTGFFLPFLKQGWLSLILPDKHNLAMSHRISLQKGF
jgi:hypothetical protein